MTEELFQIARQVNLIVDEYDGHCILIQQCNLTWMKHLHMNEVKMKKKMTKAKIKKKLQQMVRCKHQFDVTKNQPTAISTQQNK